MIGWTKWTFSTFKLSSRPRLQVFLTPRVSNKVKKVKEPSRFFKRLTFGPLTTVTVSLPADRYFIRFFSLSIKYDSVAALMA